jgi:hypothetical protein
MRYLLLLIKSSGNIFPDWDSVADCLDQFFTVIAAKTKSISQSSVIQQVECREVMNSLQKLHFFTVDLSNESLIKFMTSFVTLSVNDLAMLAGSESEPDGAIQFDLRGLQSSSVSGFWTKESENYLSSGLQMGYVSYAFKVVITTVKLNIHRLSSIWQMVASHLRFMASMKVLFSLIKHFP